MCVHGSSDGECYQVLFNNNVYLTATINVIVAPIWLIYGIPMDLIDPYLITGPAFSIVAEFEHFFTMTIGQVETFTESDIS